MKVWLVMTGAHDAAECDYGFEGIFSSIEKAREWLAGRAAADAELWEVAVDEPGSGSVRSAL